MSVTKAGLKNIKEANENCPYKRFHTKMPDGYVAFSLACDRLSKTHKQMKCVGCDRFTIWVLKDGRE